MSIKNAQRTRVATAGIVGMVFVAGFLLGMLWDRRVGTTVLPAVEESQSSAAENGRRSSRRMSFYRVEPPLTEEGAALAEAIVARRRQAARDLFEEPLIDSLYSAMKAAENEFEDVYNPRFRAIVDSTRAEIRQLMTPEQVIDYDSILAESDRRRRGGGR